MGQIQGRISAKKNCSGDTTVAVDRAFSFGMLYMLMAGMASAAAVPTEFLEFATLSLVIAISVVFLCYHFFIAFEFGAKLPKLAPEAMRVFMGYTAEDLLLSLYSKNKRGPNANWVFHFLQSRSPLGSLT